MGSLIEYNLRGNHSVWRNLINDHLNNRMSHAYFLTGPKGLGKSLTAKLYIKHILNADDVLSKRIDNNDFTDLLYISKQDKNEITIDEIRKAYNFFNQTPAESNYKFVIIDGAEDLNLNAANALLKVLEEPKNNTHLFLISHAPYKLIATIKSRCREIKFKPLADIALGTELEDFIAGSIGREKLCEELDAFKIYNQLLDLIKNDDILAFNKFADPIAKTPQKWNLVKDLLIFIINRNIKTIDNKEDSEKWFQVYDKLQKRISESEIYNLDKKQVLLLALDSIRHLNKTQ
ncbi:MAG: AAA family ATPase [Rickettsiales bacterium]|jgi:DNA polymerase-3 subunit delta'|nr:AAA family ATPase [Rickettsiales bacterium]